MDTPNTAPLRRKRGILFKLLISACSCVIAVIIAEIVLRTFFPIHYTGFPEATRYDPARAWRFKPGSYVRVTDHRQQLLVNKWGTVNFQDNLDEYRTRVFAIGDSYTQGAGVPADCAYPFQLDLILNRDASGIYHKSFSVLNLGMSGYGGKQAHLSMNEFAERIGRPSVVLYLGCDNDAMDDILFDKGWRHKSYIEGSPRGTVMVGLVQFLDRLQLFRRIKYAVYRRVQSTNDPRVAQVDGSAKRDSKDALEAPMPALSQQPVKPGTVPAARLQWPVIQAIRQDCASYGAKLVLSWADKGSSYDWLKQKADTEDIAFADWYPAAESVSTAFETLPMTNDHATGHHRSWVMRIVAEEFARHIPRDRE